MFIKNDRLSQESPAFRLVSRYPSIFGDIMPLSTGRSELPSPRLEASSKNREYYDEHRLVEFVK